MKSLKVPTESLESSGSTKLVDLGECIETMKIQIDTRKHTDHGLFSTPDGKRLRKIRTSRRTTCQISETFHSDDKTEYILDKEKVDLNSNATELDAKVVDFTIKSLKVIKWPKKSNTTSTHSSSAVIVNHQTGVKIVTPFAYLLERSQKKITE